MIQLLDVRDVADVLRITPRAVYDLVESRDASIRLPVVRIGRRVRFDPDVLTTYIQAHAS